MSSPSLVPPGYQIYVDRPVFRRVSWSRHRRKLCRIWISKCLLPDGHGELATRRADHLLRFVGRLGLSPRDIVFSSAEATFHFLITVRLRTAAITLGAREHSMKRWMKQKTSPI